jgi:hypothetical protein
LTVDIPEDPPEPLQFKLNAKFPTVSIVTVSVPLVDFVPLHAPDAAQDVESVDDQVKVTLDPTSAEVMSAINEVIFAKIAGALPPPPPPPPPHEVIRNIETRK